MLTIIEKQDQKKFIDRILKRSQMNDEKVIQTVDIIIKQVKAYGDEALFNYTRALDGAELTTFRVSDEEMNEAFKSIDPLLLADLKKAMSNIQFYHEKQKISSFEYEKEKGIIIGQRVSAIESVGIYVPGGTAAYPSTVLMNVIPAKIAGVKRIVMITPPNKQGKINTNI